MFLDKCKNICLNPNSTMFHYCTNYLKRMKFKPQNSDGERKEKKIFTDQLIKAIYINSVGDVK
jgi:hypothetical protein